MFSISFRQEEQIHDLLHLLRITPLMLDSVLYLVYSSMSLTLMSMLLIHSRGVDV